MPDLDALDSAVQAGRAEGDPLAETLGALVAAFRWAQDAPHHDGCYRWKLEPDRRRCTCGRDEALAPFGGDRG